MERKVLILSLGTGVKNSETNREYPYRMAQYRLGNDGTVITSPFVAEALIDIVEPESILIIGTVKSAWGAFYHRYHKDNCNFEEEWGKIERRIGDLGKETEYDEILNFEVSGDQIEAVHMLPGYTHNIINLSDTEDLVTVMWCNECFDPARPDTFFEPVVK